MKESWKQYIRGAVAALIAFALYAVSLGLFIALMLLVASLEEGGKNVATSTVPVTQFTVLLSQGAGFATDSFRVTIMPLLLTGLLIALIAAIARRCKAFSLQAYVAGLVMWGVLSFLCTRGIHTMLVNPLWLVLLKTLIVFSLGFAVYGLTRNDTVRAYVNKAKGLLSEPIRRCITIGVLLAGAVLAVLLALALLTVIIWAIVNHKAVGTIFTLLGMRPGSCILTTIASLAWLPNLVIWAMSWLVGAGFHIGDIGVFNLWIGQASTLPAIPMFGIFPQAVGNEFFRILLLAIPFVIAIVLAAVVMFRPMGFNFNPKKLLASNNKASSLLVGLVYPAATFCLSAVLIVFATALLFLFSNGSLGTSHLAHVGVDVKAGMQAIGHAAAIGFAAVWLVALIGTAVFYIMWCAKGKPELNNSEDAIDSSADETADGEVSETLPSDEPPAPKRTIGSLQYDNPCKEDVGTEVFEAATQGEKE